MAFDGIVRRRSQRFKVPALLGKMRIVPLLTEKVILLYRGFQGFNVGSHPSRNVLPEIGNLYPALYRFQLQLAFQPAQIWD